MLGNTDVTTLVAVRDLAEAGDFYEKKLKLVKLAGDAGWAQYRSGASSLIVYESEHAGTAQRNGCAGPSPSISSR